jgi:hypothetical protein
MIYHVDATQTPISNGAKRFVDWINGNTAGTPAPFNITDVTIAAHLIPVCAMKVQRLSEGGALSRYTPTNDCTAYFLAHVQ